MLRLGRSQLRRPGRSPLLCRAVNPAFASHSFASTPVLTPVPESAGSSNENGWWRIGKEWWSKEKPWLAPAALVGIGGLLTGIGGLLHNDKLAAEQAYEKSRRRQVDVALGKLSTTFTAFALTGDYIPRADAERSINDYISDVTPSTYVVVTAPKGCGKTTVIHHALAGRPGVVVVTVEAKSGVPDIWQLLVMALGVCDGKVVDGDAKEFIVEVCNRFASEHGGLKPVFVINIEGDRQNAESTASLAKQLGHLQKALSSDLRVAHTIADTSAIAVAAGMNNDPRAKFVDIRGLSTDEAALLLQPFADRLQEKAVLVKEVVEQIGGNPASLMAVGRNSDPRGVMARMLAKAGAEVKSYVRAHPSHKEPLRQLLLKPFGDGMLVAEFEDIAEAEAKKLKLTDLAAAAHVALLSNYVISKNLQTAKLVVYDFPQYRAGQRLAAAWAKEEARKKWWFQ